MCSLWAESLLHSLRPIYHSRGASLLGLAYLNVGVRLQGGRRGVRREERGEEGGGRRGVRREERGEQGGEG